MNSDETVEPETRTPPRSPSGDEGLSLIEVILSVAISAIAILTIVAGLTAAVRQSARTLEGAHVESVLASAADHLSAASYQPCPEQDASQLYVQSAQNAALENHWPASAVQIVDIDYWNPTKAGTDKWVEANTLTGQACNPAVLLTTSRGLQRITISASDPSGRSARTIEVVKSDVTSQPTP